MAKTLTPVEELQTAARIMRRYNTGFWRHLADWLDAEAVAAEALPQGLNNRAWKAAHAFLTGGGER